MRMFFELSEQMWCTGTALVWPEEANGPASTVIREPAQNYLSSFTPGNVPDWQLAATNLRGLVFIYLTWRLQRQGSLAPDSSDEFALGHRRNLPKHEQALHATLNSKSSEPIKEGRGGIYYNIAPSKQAVSNWLKFRLSSLSSCLFMHKPLPSCSTPHLKIRTHFACLSIFILILPNKNYGAYTY